MMLLMWKDFHSAHFLLLAINPFSPFNGLWDTFFQGYLRSVLQVSSGFGKVHVLDFGGKRFRLFVSDLGIILAQILQYKDKYLISWYWLPPML